MVRRVEGMNARARRPGLVSLVGAGPGDPRLLTALALERLRGADLVLHDALLPPSLLAVIPARVRLIAVGKRAGRAPEGAQAAIHARMIDAARSGLEVVRLKGGDPFLFGRGGEEIDALEEAGIPWEAVPGITAAFGAAASFGIPLTHRGTARALRFVTATTRDGGLPDLAAGSGTAAAIDPGAGAASAAAAAGAAEEETLVFYMAGRRLAVLARELLDSGRRPLTPVALVERATWPDETCRRMALADLASFASRRQVRSPALLIVGRTAAWGRRGPGARRSRVTIAVAGVLQDLERFAAPLRAEGAGVLEVPLLRIAPAEDRSALRDAIARLSGYRAVRFEDPHAVDPFLDRLLAMGSDLRAFAGRTIEAADPATAAALARRGLVPDRIHIRPGRAGKELPRDPDGRTLSLGGPPLAAAGARTDPVAAYGLAAFDPELETLCDEAAASPPAAWLVTSPHAAERFAALYAALPRAARTGVLASDAETARRLREGSPAVPIAVANAVANAVAVAIATAIAAPLVGVAAPRETLWDLHQGKERP